MSAGSQSWSSDVDELHRFPWALHKGHASDCRIMGWKKPRANVLPWDLGDRGPNTSPAAPSGMPLQIQLASQFIFQSCKVVWDTMLLECGLGDTYDRIQQDRNEVKSIVCFTLIRSRLSWAKESLYVHVCVGGSEGKHACFTAFLVGERCLPFMCYTEKSLDCSSRSELE